MRTRRIGNSNKMQGEGERLKAIKRVKRNNKNKRLDKTTQGECGVGREIHGKETQIHKEE